MSRRARAGAVDAGTGNGGTAVGGASVGGAALASAPRVETGITTTVVGDAEDRVETAWTRGPVNTAVAVATNAIAATMASTAGMARRGGTRVRRIWLRYCASWIVRTRRPSLTRRDNGIEIPRETPRPPADHRHWSARVGSATIRVRARRPIRAIAKTT